MKETAALERRLRILKTEVDCSRCAMTRTEVEVQGYPADDITGSEGPS
jgi:hypothetical protein